MGVAGWDVRGAGSAAVGRARRAYLISGDEGLHVTGRRYNLRMNLLPGDSTELRKARGAYFTPMAIAEHLAEWAIKDDPDASIMDPTCGDGVFLLAAHRRLSELGHISSGETIPNVYGVDLHGASLDEAGRLLAAEDYRANLIESDFFALPTPDVPESPVPLVDAVVGNPPFIRYQEHVGNSRRLSVEAALRQGVRLSGLASSWAASLAHSAGFLKPGGRLAMVLPAELLTVGYAEPVRAWLKSRFEKVNLVLFEKLQFEDALADVVLLLAEGEGGCESFSVWHVRDAEDLAQIKPYMHLNVTPPSQGKWTDLLVPASARAVYRDVLRDHFVSLSSFGSLELGAVTGANSFFVISEETRLHYSLSESQLERVSPPGTKHLRRPRFTSKDWQALRRSGERVWLFRPSQNDLSTSRAAYTDLGESLRVHLGYKCQLRSPWWRPPSAPVPDLFFTYMSHNYPRLIANQAKVGALNSMHGLKLHVELPSTVLEALPYLSLNSATMLGAEINGRSYGGGVLKMEPREAATLPLPSVDVLERAWTLVKPLRAAMDRDLALGKWTEVAKRIDQAVLIEGAGLPADDVARLLEAARSLRRRRMTRAE